MTKETPRQTRLHQSRKIYYRDIICPFFSGYSDALIKCDQTEKNAWHCQGMVFGSERAMEKHIEANCKQFNRDSDCRMRRLLNLEYESDA